MAGKRLSIVAQGVIKILINYKNISMIFRTKIIFTLIVILFSPFFLNAQTQYEVKSEKDFANVFYKEIIKYNDTLNKHVKENGILFIKFKINSGGRLDSIKYSERHPKVLLYVVTKILNTVDMILADKNQESKIYVLPVFYCYQPELKSPTTLEELQDQIPDFDKDDPMSHINFDFNGFFNVADSDKDMWGLKCVLLPMLKIARPIVYHHK